MFYFVADLALQAGRSKVRPLLVLRERPASERGPYSGAREPENSARGLARGTIYRAPSVAGFWVRIYDLTAQTRGMGEIMRLGRILLGLILVAGVLPRFGRAAADTADLEGRRKQFNSLLAEEWEYEMRESPEYATAVGDYRYNDRWSDASLAYPAKQRVDLQQWLTRFEAVDTTGFPEQETLSEKLMVRNLKERIEAIDLKLYLMPVDQFNGIHLTLATFVNLIPFNTTKQYEDYLARLHKIPVVLDQATEVLQEGEKEKMEPPAYLLDKTVTQCEAIAAAAGEANAFGMPVAHFPASIPAADQKRLHDEIIVAVDTEDRRLTGSWKSFCRHSTRRRSGRMKGFGRCRNGDALYRFFVRQQTTTNLDPETIHQLGLKEVARVQAEQLAIAKKLGFSDLKTFQASLKMNPKLVPTSREDILNIYRKYIAQMEPVLPKYFGLLPKTKLDVKPWKSFARRMRRRRNITRVGRWIAARRGFCEHGDYQHRSTPEMESTAYHEGVPGHHMQISIAQTLPELPRFRQEGGTTRMTKVGRYMRNDWGRIWDFTRIRIRITDGFRGKCCGRFGWCWIRGCITSIGRGNRWWIISMSIRRRMSRTCRRRRTGILRFRGRRSDSSWGS